MFDPLFKFLINLLAFSQELFVLKEREKSWSIGILVSNENSISFSNF